MNTVAEQYFHGNITRSALLFPRSDFVNEVEFLRRTGLLQDSAFIKVEDGEITVTYVVVGGTEVDHELGRLIDIHGRHVGWFDEENEPESRGVPEYVTINFIARFDEVSWRYLERAWDFEDLTQTAADSLRVIRDHLEARTDDDGRLLTVAGHDVGGAGRGVRG